MALLAYKKGRYILSSRPAQLLGLPPATTPQRQQQHERIFNKVRASYRSVQSYTDALSRFGDKSRKSSAISELRWGRGFARRNEGLTRWRRLSSKSPRLPCSISCRLAVRILLELDPTDDPVWIFFDTQHRHILQLLRSSAAASTSRIRSESTGCLARSKLTNELQSRWTRSETTSSKIAS